MAKAPDPPNAPKGKPPRDPAKHSKKDPAKPTRAKAARPDAPPTDPSLAQLLNPGIGQGTAGPGSQTGLQPPPDNSFDRRADFSAAHRARKSTAQAFKEAPQAEYVGKTPVSYGELDPDLARALGIEPDDSELTTETPLPTPPPQRGREQTERSSTESIKRSSRSIVPTES